MYDSQTAATITVRSGFVELDCDKGKAQLPIPVDKRSVLSNSQRLVSLVADFVILAKPQDSILVVIIESNDPADSELAFAEMLRHRSGASEAFWTSSDIGVLARITRSSEQPKERAGWQFFGARPYSPTAEVELKPGVLVFRWDNRQRTEQIPVHSRLLAPQFSALVDAILRAKRDLNVPHGVKVSISNRDSMNELDRRVVSEAVFRARLQMSSPIKTIVAEADTISPFGKFEAWLIAIMVFVGISLETVAAIYLGVACAVIGGLLLLYYFREHVRRSSAADADMYPIAAASNFLSNRWRWVGGMLTLPLLFLGKPSTVFVAAWVAVGTICAIVAGLQHLHFRRMRFRRLSKLLFT